MQYRTLGKTGVKVSEIGIGGEYLEFEDRETVANVMSAAMDLGVNLLDVFMSEPNIRTNLGLAIKGRRDKIHIQGHICSIYENGQYGRSRDLEVCKVHLDDLFRRLDTDYIDFGMVHCMDGDDEWDKVQQSGILEYMQALKKQGRFLNLGFSSHDARTALKMLQTGIFDMMLFSINPMFDHVYDSDFDLQYFMAEPDVIAESEFNLNPARTELYGYCNEHDIGITVMKPFGAGRLLKAETSPFKVAMTVPQCIHYVLSRPAVASAIVGARSVEEIRQAVAYYDATEAEKDYSGIYGNIASVSAGQCMYCNHCLPCPQNINIAEVTRLMDEAREEGKTDQARYAEQTGKASDCISCGQCESRCPFGVKIIDNMAKARQIFEG